MVLCFEKAPDATLPLPSYLYSYSLINHKILSELLIIGYKEEK
jgi:hypothetical protein